MAFHPVEESLMREPNLWVPGKKPIGPVKIDWSHSLSANLINFWLFTPNNRSYDLTMQYPTTSPLPDIGIVQAEPAASFTASTTDDEFDVSGVIDTSSGFTVLMRMNIPDFASGNYYIFHGYGTDSATDKLSFLGYSNDFIFWDYGQSVTGSGRANVSYLDYYGKWTDVGLVSSGSANTRQAIFLNGAQVTQQFGSDAPSGDVNNLTIGSLPAGEEGVDGSISYIMFFNKMFTADNIIEIQRDPYQFLVPI